jgi:hypothetical protein
MSNKVATSLIECTSAEDLIEALSPLSNHFRNYAPNAPLLFRGHGSDSYKLMPSALRSDRPLRQLTKHRCDDYESQVLAERDALIDFFLLADKRGLILPDDSQALRRRLETYRSEMGGNAIRTPFPDSRWPGNELLSLLALAQHYRLPTRLLDWTRSAYTAAYFAATDAIRLGSKQDEKLAVWCFYYPAMGTVEEIRQWHQTIIIVTAPSATNLNLRAQQGVFTMVNFLTDYKIEDLDGLTLDEALNIAAEKGVKHALESRFLRFTLPQNEAHRLLGLLAKLDITASTLFPGYAGIVCELKQRTLWDSLS